MYKCHRVNSVVILDEKVTLDQFEKDNNFDASVGLDKERNVLCYQRWPKNWVFKRVFNELGCHIEYIMQYVDDIPMIYDFNTRMESHRWLFELGFKFNIIDSNLSIIKLVMDSGASFSVINANTLTDYYDIPQSKLYELLIKQKHCNVTPETANGPVDYLATTMLVDIGDSIMRPVIVYIDFRNRLKRSLLGFDIITSFNMICKPGEAPVILGFDDSVYKTYVKEHNDADNATVDLLSIFDVHSV